MVSLYYLVIPLNSLLKKKPELTLLFAFSITFTVNEEKTRRLIYLKNTFVPQILSLVKHTSTELGTMLFTISLKQCMI